MSDSGEEKPKSVGVTDAETAAAISTPAPIVNKFYIHGSDIGLRMTLAELHGNPNATLSIRSAGFMSIPDAIELRDLLDRILKPYEEKMKQKEKDG